MDEDGQPWYADCLRVVREGPWLDRLRVFRTCVPLSVVLVAVNAWAVWWGWTIYYAAQFGRTPAVLWPFVSDSPNAVFVFVLVLVASWFGLRWAGLDLLAWVLNVKVGIWSVFVLLYWYDYFFSFDVALRWLLLWLHVGMVAQAFVVHHALRARRPSRRAWVLVGVLVVVDLVLDYVGGVSNHPFLPEGPYTFGSVVGVFTSVLVVATLAWAWSLYRPVSSQAGEAAGS